MILAINTMQIAATEKDITNAITSANDRFFTPVDTYG